MLSLDLNTKSAAILDDCTCGFPKTHHFSGTYSLSLFFLTMGQEVEKKKKAFHAGITNYSMTKISMDLLPNLLPSLSSPSVLCQTKRKLN